MMVQAADGLDHDVSCFLDLLHPHRSEQLDLLGQVRGGPLDRLCMILSRTSSLAPLRAMATSLSALAHDLLDGAVIELDDVGEHEQMPADLLAELGHGSSRRSAPVLGRGVWPG